MRDTVALTNQKLNQARVAKNQLNKTTLELKQKLKKQFSSSNAFPGEQHPKQNWVIYEVNKPPKVINSATENADSES